MTPARNDEIWMRRALALARRGEGLTRPNPPVGAVIAKAGRLLASGFHERAGGPHAEALALRAAGRSAKGATLYVSLEPCSTHGRTPPCTEAILRAGIRRVVVAAADRNPKHAGRGLVFLRRHGIQVATGVCEAGALELLRPFFTWILTGRPLVTLKLGITLDGRISDASGHSRWITSPAALRCVQSLRRRADAVLVGVGTAVADDPSLMPRPALGRSPFRVVVDSKGRLPARAKVLTDGFQDRTIVATTRQCPASIMARWAKAGARVWILPAARQKVSLAALVKRLGGEGLLHVLCEGGGELAAGLVQAGLVDDFLFFLAPKLLGAKAVPAIGGAGWALAGAPALSFKSVRKIGPDLLVHAIRQV